MHNIKCMYIWPGWEGFMLSLRAAEAKATKICGIVAKDVFTPPKMKKLKALALTDASAGDGVGAVVGAVAADGVGVVPELVVWSKARSHCTSILSLRA
jgi:hypothetical protein